MEFINLVELGEYTICIIDLDGWTALFLGVARNMFEGFDFGGGVLHGI